MMITPDMYVSKLSNYMDFTHIYQNWLQVYVRHQKKTADTDWLPHYA